MAPRLIAAGLHIIPGMVNMYLIDAPESMILVDAGFPNSEGTVFDALRSLGREPRDLGHVILTHAHPDHIGSLAAIVRRSGATTYMAAADRPIAEAGGGFRPMEAAPGLLPGLLFRLFSRRNATVEPARIDRTLDDEDIIPLAGGLRVVGVPGHCAGQVALLWPSRGVLFTGDACSNMMGLGPPIGYEDRAEGERSQRKLAGLDFEIACFGHGKPIHRDAAARFRTVWA